MISEQMGMWLHDRATRGETLTAEEKAQLEQWYAAEDEAEMRMLAPALAQLQASPLDVSALRSELEIALAQLTASTKQIEQVMLENEALRQEIAGLKQQLKIALSGQDLIVAVDQLTQLELDQFIAQILQLRAKRQDGISEAQQDHENGYSQDNSVLKFAGCWGDWSPEEFDEFAQEVVTRRQAALREH